MSPIAAANRQIVSRPQTSHAPTTPAPQASAPKAAPTPTAPASTPAPAPQALNANAMSVLIDVQAKLAGAPGKAAEAIGQVIDRFEDRRPQPAPQPQPAPAPKPAVIPGGDAGAAKLSSAAVAARLLEEGGMLQAAAARSAGWAQQRADQQVADANTGITLLKATLAGYQAWQGDLAKPDARQVSIAA